MTADPDDADLALDDAVWITSTPDPDGRYHVEVSTDPDHSFVLSRTAALRYAGCVAAAAERAYPTTPRPSPC